MRKLNLVLSLLLFFSSTLFSQEDDSILCFEKCGRAATSLGTERVNYFQYPSMDKYDLDYLKLDLKIEANDRTISGSALLRVIAKQPMDSFICELKPTMIIDSLFINGIKVTTFTRANDHVFVQLAPALPPVAVINALFYYHGTASASGVFAGTVATSGLIYTASLSESYQAREWFPIKGVHRLFGYNP